MVKRVASLLAGLLLASCGGTSSRTSSSSSGSSSFPSSSMELTSTAFAHQGDLPSAYACDGQGVSPPLSIANVPPDARSLALILDDPDAPSGTFIHWVLWNIPPAAREIAEGAVPDGALTGTATTGDAAYVPPCPPSGTHHYRFRLFALDVTLGNPSPLTAEALGNLMEGHVLAEAELVGLYQRI